MIEEEGVEELHFTFVALNNYKLKVLENKDWRGMIKYRK